MVVEEGTTKLPNLVVLVQAPRTETSLKTRPRTTQSPLAKEKERGKERSLRIPRS